MSMLVLNVGLPARLGPGKGGSEEAASISEAGNPAATNDLQGAEGLNLSQKEADASTNEIKEDELGEYGAQQQTQQAGSACKQS